MALGARENLRPLTSQEIPLNPPLLKRGNIYAVTPIISLFIMLSITLGDKDGYLTNSKHDIIVQLQ